MAHALLRSATDPDGVQFPRVDTKKQTLSETSPSYTTLHTLSTIVENYLVEIKTPEKVSSWLPVVRGVYRRPDNESLKIGTRAMTEYLNALVRLPSHEAFIQGKRAGEIRSSDGDDNVLFRPIAQTALAVAVGTLSREGVSLATIADVLATQEERGQLRLTDPGHALVRRPLQPRELQDAPTKEERKVVLPAFPVPPRRRHRRRCGQGRDPGKVRRGTQGR